VSTPLPQHDGADPGPGEAGDPRTVLSLIRDLQAGRVAGSSLSTSDRRRVVEQLALEGYSVAEIAEILKVSERTIARDRAAVRATHALSPSPELVRESAGMLVRQAEAGIGRLRKLGRDRDVPAAVKVQAEMAAWAISKDVVSKLQSLGYLPTAATRIEATLDARVETDSAPSYGDLQQELDRLERILGADASASAEFQELVRLRDTVARLSVGQQLRTLALPQRELIDQPDDVFPPSSASASSTDGPPAPREAA
jgi:DNA-binding CsgD family transcriptional regulator